MTHATALAQHILTLEPEKDAARLSFYHFLKNLCDASEPVTAEVLSRYFCRALHFSHWQENKDRLFQEIGMVLQHFQDTHAEPLPISEMPRPEDLQIVPIESLRTMEKVIGNFFEQHSHSFAQFRLLPHHRDNEDELLAIVLQKDRSLRICSFSKVLAIRGGELTPLTLDFTLFYASDLQLHSQVLQNLQVAPHTTARFSIDRDPQTGAESVNGTVVRGYTFQKFAALEGGPLHQYPLLFYPLKRLEQHFVNRRSDPMYQELTSLLEKSLEVLSQRHPDGLRFAEAAYERGKLALENIFPDDKFVRLLISNLEKSLALEYSNAELHKGPQ